MKKIYNIGFACMLCTFSLVTFAQPTITQNANHQVNDELMVYDADASAINQGASGADITWNFQDLEVLDSLKATFINPESSPYGATFLNTNIAIEYEKPYWLSSYALTYEFYSFVNSNLTRLGIVNNGDDLVTYDNSQILLAYPFTYGSGNEDTYSADYLSGANNIIEEGTITLEGDAYGTLKLPYGTIDNVLRIKTIMDYTQDIDGVLELTYHVETYAWYHPSSSYPLLYIYTEQLDGGNAFKKVKYSNNNVVNIAVGVNDITRHDFSLTSYPNPATNNEVVTVAYELDKPAQVQVNVYNMLGQLMTPLENAQRNAGQHNLQLSLKEYPRGVYFVELTTSDEKRQMIKILVQ